MISVISPVYGCRDCLESLVERVREALDGAGLSWELVLVDDCSLDQAWEVIDRMARDEPRVHGVKLSRNHGQQLAIWAGFEIARGDWVAVIDCDLQDDPAQIPKLFDQALADDVEAVVVQRGISNGNRLRRMASQVYLAALKHISGFDIGQDVGNFGIYSRRMVNTLLSFQDQEVFLPWMVVVTGLSRSTMTVSRSEREAGSSSYSLGSLIGMAAAGIIRFSDRPLQISVILGLGMSAFSALISIWVFTSWVVGATSVQGWTSIMLAMWFLSGLILAVLGIHGAYLGRVFREVKGRPRIIVEQFTDNCSDPSD